MAPVLYYLSFSPPSQLVLIIAKHLNIDIELKEVLPVGDGITTEFLKVNPTHTVPALDDNGFYLPESRAIAFYLLEQYGNDDPLLPKDPKSRALVLQRLIFDEDLWNRGYRSCVRPIYFDNKWPSEDDYAKFEEGLGFLNTFLDGNKYLAGDKITLADYSTVLTLNYFDVVSLTDLKKFPLVSSWFQKVKKEIKEYDEIVEPNDEKIREYYKEKFLGILTTGGGEECF